ncbi:MAG: hypothetical protein EOO56_19820 [Hymenobacter sp.]|nr:MAG: hypothetical protein EOO56_19820 [Hymenobacter sp.]
MLLLPPLTYFGLFLWQKLPGRVSWAPELLVLLVLGGVWALRYRELVPGLQGLLRLPAESRFSPQPASAYAHLASGSVLVLGPDRRPYLTHPAARPYLDWPLAQQDFGRLNEYAAVVHIAASLDAHPPTYVIDQQGKMSVLRYLLPGLFGRYETVPNQPGVYRRR